MCSSDLEPLAPVLTLPLEVGGDHTAREEIVGRLRVEVPADCQAGSSPLIERATLATLTVMAPTLPLG